MTNQDGTVRRIYHAETVRQKNKAGLRIGEILGKRWRRIDLLHGMMDVAETYSSGEFDPPETRSRRRTIPISSSPVEIFKRLRPLSCEPETLVFMTAKGTSFNSKTCTIGNSRRRRTRSDCRAFRGIRFVTRMPRWFTNRANL